MGVSYEYETTIKKLIADLKELGKKHGINTKVMLPNSGYFDPNFEGRNSKLTAIFSERIGRNHVIIVEKDIE